ncbi:hypothetical protein ACJX0J_010814, partial [Zea mays]
QETHEHGDTHSSPESPERKRRRPSLDGLRPGTSTSSAPGTQGYNQEQGHHRCWNRTADTWRV